MAGRASSKRAWVASLAAVCVPVAAQVSVNVVSAPVRGAEFYIANNSQKSLTINVEFEAQCEEGGTSTGIAVVETLSSGSSTRWPAKACARSIQLLRVLNVRWGPSEWQTRKDRNDLWLQQMAQEEERRKQEKQRSRMASCHIDANGGFTSNDVAYGKIPHDCYTWFPELRTAAEGVKQEEQRRRDAALKNMENARLEAAEQGRMQRDRVLMQQVAARERAQLAEAERRKQEEKDRLDRDRALQAENEQRMRDDLARQERYKTDPCGAVAEIRASQPDLKTPDPNATASQRSYAQQLNQQQVAAWNEQLSRRTRECQDLRDRPAREAAARAEAERRVQAQAQAQAQAKADYRRMVQETQASSQRMEREAKAMRDDNAELWRLIQGAKP